MSRAGKWFLARPARKGPGPVFLCKPPGFTYCPLPPVTGSTSMSAS